MKKNRNKPMNIQWIDILPSTNDYLKKLINENNISHKTIISVHHQTHGKGQKQNLWFSEPRKNLTFSIYLQLQQHANNLFALNKLTACTLIDFFTTIDRDNEYFIKWPNDIIVHHKKIAGILIETIIEQNFIHCIIGIGINVHQTEFPLMKFPPTSLYLVTGKTFNLNELLEHFSHLFERKYEDFLQNNTFVHQEYNKNLYLRNQICHHLINDMVCTGAIREVDNSGRLIIETDQNHMQVIEHGQWQPVIDQNLLSSSQDQ